MFGLFDSWKSKTLRRMFGGNPIGDRLWISGSMATIRIEELRDRERIPNIGTRHLQLVAFYLGLLEASVRMLVNVDSTGEENIGMLSLRGAVYTAVKNDIATNDAEMYAVGTQFEIGYRDPENIDFRRLGLGAGGLTSADAELFWSKLDEAIISGRVVAPELGIKGKDVGIAAISKSKARRSKGTR